MQPPIAFFAYLWKSQVFPLITNDLEMIINKLNQAYSLLITVVCVLSLSFSLGSCNKQESSIFCETGESSDITSRSATLSGRAYLPTDLTGSIIIGFLLSTQDNPSVGNSIVFNTNEMDQTGLFQKTIIGLEPATMYYYRAFVLRNDIYVYGNVLSFETINEISISVKAYAVLSYANGDVVQIDPVFFKGFHRDILTDYDLEDIFIDLTRYVSDNFKTAVIHLSIYDEISGKHLRDESYAVVYNTHTGHYDFVSTI